MSSVSREASLGMQHYPEAGVLEEVKEELERQLPNDYKVEEVNGYVHPPEDLEMEEDPVMGVDPAKLMRREEDVTYFVTDPTGHEVAEIGFNTSEVREVEKVTSYRFLARNDREGSIPDQAYKRLRRFGDELEDLVQAGRPERPVDEWNMDKLVRLNYDGEERPLDEAETEQFQKAVQVLEETDRAYIDPEWSDRDIFYDSEELSPGMVHVVTEDYQDLLNFMRNTEIYVESSMDPSS